MDVYRLKSKRLSMYGGMPYTITRENTMNRRRFMFSQPTPPRPKSMSGWCLDYLNEFLGETSFHAFTYFRYIKKRPIEVAAWLLVWLCAVVSSVNIIMSNWNRFQSNPTVISVNRNYRSFLTTFPAGTLCYNYPFNSSRISAYKKEFPVSGMNKSAYTGYLRSIGSVNLVTLTKYIDEKNVPNTDFYQIIQKIKKDFNGTVTSSELKMIGRPVPLMTESGLCYSLNSAIGNYSHDRRKGKVHTPMTINDVIKIQFRDGGKYIGVDNFEGDRKLYIHSPTDFPEISPRYYQSKSSWTSLYFYQAKELVTSESLRSLSVKQRGCRFQDESNLIISPIYSTTLCRLQCRIKLAVKLCGCSPYFYPLVDNVKQCDIKGLGCIMKKKIYLTGLRYPDTNNRVKCGCIPLCNIVNYVLDDVGLSKWQPTVKWFLNIFPKVQLQRHIVYGPTELIVSFGGTAGLFLGCSFLSWVELIYYYTLRLVWRLIRDRRNFRKTHHK